MWLICSQAPLQVQPAVHALDPQMVLLVDHQADLLLRIDQHAAGALAFGVLAADELPLDQELPVDAVQLADVDVVAARRKPAAWQSCSRSIALDLGAVVLAGPADEREIGQVAGQADAAAHDDVGLRPGAAQPFADRRRCKFV